MLWNLYLAGIPVVLAQLIVMLGTLRKKTVLGWTMITVLGIVWLVFLPNTCYLLTEWRHFLIDLDAGNLYLRSRLNTELTLYLMIYTAFYSCYSGIGMIAFTLAIRPLAKLINRSGFNTWVLGIPLFIMLSIGVYLGLVLRYNSWDMMNRPSEVISSITAITNRPLLAGMVIGFAAFLWLSYFALDVWIDGFLSRWKTITAQKSSR